eukprot:gene25303-10957_t
MALQQAAAKRGKGIALGVLGVIMLVMFSLMFMVGRHTHWAEVYDEMVHPFDAHPDGLVKHHTTVLHHDAGKVTVSGIAHEEEIKQAVEGTNMTQPTRSTEQTAAKEEKVEPAVEVKPAVKVKPAVEVKPNEEKKPAEVVKSTETVIVKAETKEPEEKLSMLDEKYTPTKEMVAKIAQDGYLVVTWANWHYQDFVHTWVGITGYIVGAMDEQLLETLIKEDVNCFSMKSGLTLGDFGWGSKTFAKMGREKIRLIALFLKLGVHVVIADVDVLFLRNPIPYFQRYPTADMLTSSDHLSNTVNDESLERWPQAGSAANIGIMMFREKSLDFVHEWIELIEKDETVWDQNAFNDLFKKGSKPLPDDPQGIFLAYNGKLRTGILPVSIFCSGHTYFTQRMYEALKLDVYAVHATFQFSGTPGKRNRMREKMFFNDPPEYFNHDHGFVSFNFGDLTELLKTAGPNTNGHDLANVQGHFKLVNHEILLTRNAMAIATVLGRAVVMPQLYCGLDRWWAPHAGTIPGSKFGLPFPCPLDHVFDLEGGWARDFGAPDAFGPNIEYREHSFFNNKRMTPAVRDSKVVVEICPAGKAECSDGSAAAPVVAGRVKIQAGLLSEKLKTALGEASKFKVLEFSTMQGAMANFTKPEDWGRFANRMRQYGSIWCCIMAHPGHIHYDMLWDVEHKDKFDRKWGLPWETKTGP